MGNIEQFDLIAAKYDTPERAEIAKMIANAMRKHITSGKEKTAIDFGCGTGLIGLELLDDFQSILFIDASYNMVGQVKQKIEKAQIKNAEALCIDLTEECPLNLHADYILMAQVLLHMKGIEPLLACLYSVLNKGGRLLIVDFDKNEAVESEEVHNGFEQAQLVALTKRLGFTQAEAETIYYGEKILMNKNASLFLLDALK